MPSLAITQRAVALCSPLCVSLSATACSIDCFLLCLLHCPAHNDFLGFFPIVNSTVVPFVPLCLLLSVPPVVLSACFPVHPTLLPSSFTVCLLFYNIIYPTVCISLLTTVHCPFHSIACSIAFCTACSTVPSAVFYTVHLTAFFALSTQL